MTFDQIFLMVFAVVMVAVAWFAIEARNPIDNVVGVSLIGLLSVIGFLMMQAPDVAVTAAVIGSGLSSAMFVLTMIKMRRSESQREERS